jgi:hypothetical protein
MAMPAATGSSLIAALEHTWTTIRKQRPELPEVVFITGTGLRHATASSVDAKWGHFGAQRWVKGRPQPTSPPPTETSQTAGLHVQPDRKPELFVAGECFAEGATHTLVTILHEAVHALAHVRGVKDTSRQGKYHNRRFLELAAELDLEWPADAKAHPVAGFSEVRLSEVARIFYADTIAELDAAIGLHLDSFRRLRLGGVQTTADTTPEGDGAGGEEGGGKTFNRSKLVCDCYPERSIRVSPKQAERGPILCGMCGAEFRSYDEPENERHPAHD